MKSPKTGSMLRLRCVVFATLWIHLLSSTHQSPPVIKVAAAAKNQTSFHFHSPQNWLNDPNGPMYYEGLYHLFYQYNPYAAVFGDQMIWAHSVSYDLINWVHINPALLPSEPFDINSCWSGSVTILPGNKPVILYTGIDANSRQVQNLATPKNLSDPLLREWVKYSQNPVMTPPDGVNKDLFRDPTTAWLGADGKWRVIVGGSVHECGIAFLYRSDDFVHWTEYETPLYSSNRTGMWECPDFYPVAMNSKNGVDTSVNNATVKHVLKASFNAHDHYILGSYDPDKERYLPDSDFTATSLDLRYDYGKLYASKTFFDGAKNRRILWAWVNESDSMEDDVKKGWSGVQSIPRKIWLDESEKQLMQWPVEEIEQLRSVQVSFQGKKLESGSIIEVSGITTAQADVEVIFKLPALEDAEVMNPSWNDPQLICSSENALVNGRIGPFGLFVLATKDLKERTAIFFRVFKGNDRYLVLMCSDQYRSSLKENVDKTTYGAFLDIDPRHDQISLRILIDHSIVESFGGGGRTVITTRIYPELAIDKESYLYAFNNGTVGVEISSLNAWSMNNALFQSKRSLSFRASYRKK